MIFKIQLTHPARRFLIIFRLLLQFFKETKRIGKLDFRHCRNPLGQPLAVFNHPLGRSAAAVAPAVTNQHFIAQILLLVSFPRTAHRIGIDIAVIGSKELLRQFVKIGRRDKMRQNAAAVQAHPAESIIGQLIVFIPADFGRHKIRNMRLL